jgi:hypothetical protein
MWKLFLLLDHDNVGFFTMPVILTRVVNSLTKYIVRDHFTVAVNTLLWIATTKQNDYFVFEWKE